MDRLSSGGWRRFGDPFASVDRTTPSLLPCRSLLSRTSPRTAHLHAFGPGPRRSAWIRPCFVLPHPLMPIGVRPTRPTPLPLPLEGRKDGSGCRPETGTGTLGPAGLAIPNPGEENGFGAFRHPTPRGCAGVSVAPPDGGA
eukprot:scaffold252_cov338-Pavlova_lutheri.AAC.6